MSQDWDIKPRSTACLQCQTAFVDRQPYFSALSFGAEGYSRGDFCSACWTARPADGRAHSSWQGVYLVPPPPPAEPLKKETAESLLRDLIEQEDETRAAAVYILGVMLERKKLLVERDVQYREDGKIVRVYEHRKTGETFTILDPRLRLDQLEEVQQQVVALLGGDRKEPAPAVAAAAPVPADAAAAPPPGFKNGFYSKETAG